jgi:hypothetical protein
VIELAELLVHESQCLARQLQESAIRRMHRRTGAQGVGQLSGGRAFL